MTLCVQVFLVFLFCLKPFHFREGATWTALTIQIVNWLVVERAELRPFPTDSIVPREKQGVTVGRRGWLGGGDCVMRDGSGEVFAQEQLPRATGNPDSVSLAPPCLTCTHKTLQTYLVRITQHSIITTQRVCLTQNNVQGSN